MLLRKKYLRFVAFMLVVLMTFGMIPVNTFAADGDDVVVVDEVGTSDDNETDDSTDEGQNYTDIAPEVLPSVDGLDIAPTTDSYEDDQDIEASEEVDDLGEDEELDLEGEELLVEESYEAAGARVLVGEGDYAGIHWKAYDSNNDKIGDIMTLSGKGKMSDDAFYWIQCYDKYTSIETVIIEKGITSVSDFAFNYCENIKRVELPEGITDIGDFAFSGCKSLTDINIPSGVKNIGAYAFSECDSLTSIELPEGVTYIGVNTFERCDNLTSATIPESVNIIPDYIFLYCSKLKNVKLPSEAEYLGNSAFSGCSSLDDIVIPSGISFIGDETFCDCSSLSSIVIPEGIPYIKTRAFAGCSNLQSVEMKNGVLYIGSNAFSFCNKLSNVTFSKSLYAVSYSAFQGCHSLTDIELPSSLEYLSDSVFYDCTSLKNVTILGSLKDINDYTFEYCSSLETIEIANGISSIGYRAFAGCYKLKNITIPESVTSLGRESFYMCSSLTQITIPQGVWQIPSYAFADCDSLEQVVLPNSVQNIDYGAFEDCYSLSNIELSEDIYDIGSYAFYNCRNLKGDIYLPSVEYIGYYAFYGCDSLDSIIFANYSVQATDNTVYPYSSDVMIYVVKDSPLEKIVKLDRVYGSSYKYVEDYYGTRSVVLDSASLTLDGSVSINFYFKLPSNLIKDTKSYIMVGDTKYLVSNATAVPGEPNTYKISYPVPAKNIKDNYSFAVYDGSGNKQILLNSNNVEVLNDTYNYSVYKYCNAVIDGNYNQKQRDIANAIITYGSYSMNYFGYGDAGDSLPTVSSLSSAELASYKSTSSGTMPANISYVGNSLLLKSKVKMRLYFEVDNPSNIASYKATIDGKTVGLKRLNNTNVYYIDSPNINTNALGRMSRITIADSKSSYSINMSPLSYVYSISLSGDKEIKNLCSSLYGLYKATISSL